MPNSPLDLILWQDEHILVVNKPAGMPTLVDGWNPEAPFLVSLLREALGEVWVVHRLDRDTSGIMVLARSAEAHRSLNMQFEQRQVAKIYHAIAQGSPDWQEKVVRLPLRTNVGHKHRTMVDHKGGKPAVTGFRVLERLGAFTLLEARPQTGRTHQIRAHLSALDLPLTGDGLYGGSPGIYLSQFSEVSERQERRSRSLPQLPERSGPVLTRAGLHAFSLSFDHPATGEHQQFEAPYPADFERALRLLRRKRR